MHWLYLLIAACFEVCWLYSLKFIDLKALKAIAWNEIAQQSFWLKVAPVLGYVLFGIGNIIFFSMAMRKIPPSTAFAVWLGIAMAVTKIIDITVFKQPFSFSQIIFIMLILAGLAGLKLSENT